MRSYQKNSFYVILVAVVAFLSSCGSTKDVAYFQNSKDVDLTASQMLYDARIMPKDQLTITVSATNDMAAAPFNMTVPTPYTANQRSTYSQAMLQTYLVDNEGKINFPIIGELKVGGLTKSEAETLIREKILPYMSEVENPIVTVRMTGYQISVLGEVNRPGTFTVSREKITVLEALAQAGDLTIYGVRNNVQLIREDAAGKKSIHFLNLNDANIINSPYYYMQQRDILYVQPNEAKSKNADIGNTAKFWIKGASIGISLASLIYSIVK